MRRRDYRTTWFWAVGIVSVLALAFGIVAVIVSTWSETETAEQEHGFYHHFTLGKEAFVPVALTRTDLNASFEATAYLHVDDDRRLMHLRMPAIQFYLESPPGTPVAGYLYTLPNSTLHWQIWPQELTGQAIAAPCATTALSMCYSYLILPDGTVTLQLQDGSPLPASSDGHRVPATTIAYELPPHRRCVPENVKLTTGPTAIVGSAMDAHDLDFVDYYAIDSAFDDDTGLVRFAFAWPDNSDEASAVPRDHTNIALRTVDVDPDGGSTVWSSMVVALQATDLVFYADAKVAVDPNDVDHIVVHATKFDWHYAAGAINNFVTVVTVSADGGQTWTAPAMPWAANLFASSPWLVIDGFGNCFASASVAVAPSNSAGPFALSVLSSVDGCLTFVAQVVSVPTTDVPGNGIVQSPRIAFGPDGSGLAGDYALWFVVLDVHFTTTVRKPTVGYLPVTGLGSFGAQFSTQVIPQLPSGPNPYNNLQVVVNPNSGAVYLFGALIGNPSTEGDGAQVAMWVNPTGTVGFSGAAFRPRRDVQYSNMNAPGGLPGSSWQPNRGLIGLGSAAAAYDSLNDVLCYVGLDMRPALSNTTFVTLACTENEGQTWTAQLVANGYDTGDFAAMPSISMQQGATAAQWLDPRNSDDGTTIDTYAVVLTDDDWEATC